LTTGAPSFTVNASFSTSGLQARGFMSFASIQSVTIAFIPEPSPIVLVGVGLGAMMIVGRTQQRRSA
jgi:hypothetical protein